MSRSPTKSSGVETITITARNTISNTDFKKKLSSANESRVQWVNRSNTPRIITFVAAWPFYGLQATIYVPQNGSSDIFTVNSSQPKMTYYYTLSPQASGPPDGPAVIVNGG